MGSRYTPTQREEILRAALEEIVSPCAFMRKRADAEGLHLNGIEALRLAKDPFYLQEIARTALKATAA